MGHSRVALGGFTAIALHAMKVIVVNLNPKMADPVAVNAVFYPSR